jgi:GTP-binding protein HflX
LSEIGAAEKKIILIFNKIDAYTYIQKDTDDLTPIEQKNFTLEQLKNTWMAQINHPAIFISAKQKDNWEELKDLLYEEVKQIHIQRFPYNDFLF